MTGAEVRARARAGGWRGTTRGAAPGHVQCNVAILPAGEAEDFATWCERNPSVAPVLARSDPGDPRMPELGDIDLRYDLPGYLAFEGGEETAELPGFWACGMTAQLAITSARPSRAYTHISGRMLVTDLMIP